MVQGSRTEKKKPPILIFLTLSVLLHLLALLLFKSQWGEWARELPTPPTVWIDLKKEILPRRIADIPKPKKEETPDKASAQALYSQKVAEEMVNPLSPSQPASPADVPSPPAPPQKSEKEEKSLADVYAMREFRQEAPRRAIPPAERGLGTVGSNDDFFPDYKMGERTYLNTLANPDIAYYVELKRKFKTTFNPVPSLRGRLNEVSRGQIDVVVGVSVDARGELAGLVVIRPSGIETYDLEGKRTVRASAPFSAPPANLLGPDGLLHMAWTFVVYL